MSKSKKLISAGQILKGHKLTFLVLSLFLVLALASRMQDLSEIQAFSGTVVREDSDGSTQTQDFRFHLEKETGDQDALTEEVGEQELTLEIAPLALDREEAFALLTKAAEEWEEIFLGENVSVNEVRQDLVLPSTLCDGMVSVDYESSDYEVLTADGTVVTEGLSAEGELVTLTVRFSYGDYTQIEEYTLLVLPPAEGSAEWVLGELQREAEQTEETTREEDTFSLPDVIGGYRVIWEQREDNSWIYFLLLGGVAVFCLEWRGRQQEQQKKKKRAARLEMEYPEMVDQIAVLLESGMSIRKAWERILLGARYAGKNETPKNREGAVYLEEMWITYREIQEGRGEREAYERFGERIGLLPYKRFSSILTQNLSKGTMDMKEMLRRESKEALEERKTRARKLGEEAGTKMLFPMLVMLLLILLVLLFPALANL